MSKQIFMRLWNRNYQALAKVSQERMRSVSSIISICLNMLYKKLESDDKCAISIIVSPDEMGEAVKTSISLNPSSYDHLAKLLDNGRLSLTTAKGMAIEKDKERLINATIAYYRSAFDKEGIFNLIFSINSESKKSKYEQWRSINEKRQLAKLNELRKHEEKNEQKD